ncbi:hypothetical protein DPMN_041213 [Dreissena polymorpha]|uniref:Uncharacterized protein n=1 Tax=Dreissena polymorpha TaxID=45954 RepID=A0A9D4CYY3_DREPO|nr:hypothetical protein DPMN_041213 [Dreissena polymorpha]
MTFTHALSPVFPERGSYISATLLDHVVKLVHWRDVPADLSLGGEAARLADLDALIVQ